METELAGYIVAAGSAAGVDVRVGAAGGGVGAAGKPAVN